MAVANVIRRSPVTFHEKGAKGLVLALFLHTIIQREVYELIESNNNTNPWVIMLSNLELYILEIQVREQSWRVMLSCYHSLLVCGSGGERGCQTSVVNHSAFSECLAEVAIPHRAVFLAYKGSLGRDHCWRDFPELQQQDVMCGGD